MIEVHKCFLLKRKYCQYFCVCVKASKLSIMNVFAWSFYKLKSWSGHQSWMVGFLCSIHLQIEIVMRTEHCSGLTSFFHNHHEQKITTRPVKRRKNQEVNSKKTIGFFFETQNIIVMMLRKGKWGSRTHC